MGCLAWLASTKPGVQKIGEIGVRSLQQKPLTQYSVFVSLSE